MEKVLYIEGGEQQPVLWLNVFLACLVLTLLCWQVNKHKDLQMRGKRKRGGKYSEGLSANILSEMSELPIHAKR